jgi:cytochrome b
MWWERWIPKSYLTKSSVCGVECIFDDKGITFHYSVLQIKKNKIDVLESGTTTEVSDILKIAKKANAPIVLSVIGKGIITKKIVFSETDALQLSDLVKQHLQTINPNDFYIQFYKNDTQSGFLSVCRKEQIDELIKQFSTTKQECVNVFIGSLVCNALSSLTSSHNRIYTSINQLDLINGYIDTISLKTNTDESYSLTIGDLEIVSNQTISFASGFSYLTRQHNFIADDSAINNLLSKHTEKLKLRLLLLVFIAFIFVISAVNSMLFFQKFEENTTLEAELNLYESKNAQITQLLDNYQKKKSLIEQAGIFDNKKLSVYADKIGASLPEEIVLRELYFNPEIGETEEDSLMDFKEHQLIIKGNCNKSLILNEWVNVLKSQSFVKSVNLENFIFNSEGHLPNFVLKLETE